MMDVKGVLKKNQYEKTQSEKATVFLALTK